MSMRLIAENSAFSQQDWESLLLQYGNGCALCGSDQDVLPDLVLPEELGGQLSIDNVQPLCSSCLKAKRNFLVDYRPFTTAAFSSLLARGDARTAEVEALQGPQDVEGADHSCTTREAVPVLQNRVPKTLTQKQLLAIEDHYLAAGSQGATDYILEQDLEIALLLVEEIKRLRALMVVRPGLARVESIAWRDRFASLTRSRKLPRAS